MCANSSTDTKKKIKKVNTFDKMKEKNHVSCAMCQVICHFLIQNAKKKHTFFFRSLPILSQLGFYLLRHTHREHLLKKIALVLTA